MGRKVQDNRDIRIIPYCPISYEGYWSLPDEYIKFIYFQIDNEGKVPLVFCNKSVQSEYDMIGFFQTGDNRLFLLALGEGEDLTLGGIFWLNCFEGKTCRCHFCFFKAATPWETRAMGKMVVHEVLHMPSETGELIIDTVLGVTPVSNKMACNFIQKIGMKPLGEIKGIIGNHYSGRAEDGLLSYATRESI